MKEHEVNKREIYISEGNEIVKLYYVDGEFDYARISAGEYGIGGSVHVDKKSLPRIAKVISRAFGIVGDA